MVDIWCRSTPGQAASTDRLGLPRPTGARVAHVYLVDDDATLRQLLARRVQQAGHRVTAVGSGAEALDAVRQTGPPDVAVLDVMMPERTGFELLTLLEERLLGRALTG